MKKSILIKLAFLIIAVSVSALYAAEIPLDLIQKTPDAWWRYTVIEDDEGSNNEEINLSPYVIYAFDDQPVLSNDDIFIGSDNNVYVQVSFYQADNIKLNTYTKTYHPTKIPVTIPYDDLAVLGRSDPLKQYYLNRYYTQHPLERTYEIAQSRWRQMIWYDVEFHQVQYGYELHDEWWRVTRTRTFDLQTQQYVFGVAEYDYDHTSEASANSENDDWRWFYYTYYLFHPTSDPVTIDSYIRGNISTLPFLDMAECTALGITRPEDFDHVRLKIVPIPPSIPLNRFQCSSANASTYIDHGSMYFVWFDSLLYYPMPTTDNLRIAINNYIITHPELITGPYPPPMLSHWDLKNTPKNDWLPFSDFTLHDVLKVKFTVRLDEFIYEIKQSDIYKIMTFNLSLTGASIYTFTAFGISKEIDFSDYSYFFYYANKLVLMAFTSAGLVVLITSKRRKA